MSKPFTLQQKCSVDHLLAIAKANHVEAHAVLNKNDWTVTLECDDDKRKVIRRELISMLTIRF